MKKLRDKIVFWNFLKFQLKTQYFKVICEKKIWTDQKPKSRLKAGSALDVK